MLDGPGRLDGSTESPGGRPSGDRWQTPGGPRSITIATSIAIRSRRDDDYKKRLGYWVAVLAAGDKKAHFFAPFRRAAELQGKRGVQAWLFASAARR